MKKTKQKHPFSASQFRILLLVVLFIEVALAIGLFVVGHNQLSAVADEVIEKKNAAAQSSDSLSKLRTLERELDENADIKSRLDAIYASGELPQFAAVNTLTRLANRYNIPIGNVTFVEETAPAASVTPSAVPGANSPTQQSGQSTKTANTIRVSFEITRNVSYRTFIRFLNATEYNTPKLQVESVNLPAGSSATSVRPAQLTVKVFVQ